MTEQFNALCSHRRVVILTDGHTTPFLAKTAISLLRYRGQDIAAVLDRELAGQTTDSVFAVGGDTPFVSELGSVPDADALYVGIAPPGGKLPASWRPTIEQAIRRGLTVVSGLHDFLQSDPGYCDLARKHRARLIDVRQNQFHSTAAGHAFPPENVRIHTVGHDCSIGKMVAAVELHRGLMAAGQDAAFLATGQTGIMISGRGIPIDCVVADFVNGAAEQLAIEHQSHDFSIIEGQGSISHPAYSAVTLGLLHGSAPDGLVFCYEAGRDSVKGFHDLAIPEMELQIRAFESLANLRHPCETIGVAVNTRCLDEVTAQRELETARERFGLPVCDVYRTGVEPLVNAAMELKNRKLAASGLTP